jgi:hypothetical protein
MKQRDNSIEQGSNMTETTSEENQDWIVPAVLVAVIAVLGLIIVLVLATQTVDEEDDTIAGQLATWSSCLRGKGANVPLVETVRDGGFRITVDGSLVEEGIDEAALRPALEACEDQAPEGVQRVMALFDGFAEFPGATFEMSEEFEFLHEFGDFEEFSGFGFFDEFGRPGGPRLDRDIDRMELTEVCGLIDRGEIDPAAVPRLLLRLCR